MTYEYLCTNCQHAWEAEQSISEAALKLCPHCKHETAKRQVSGGAGFILKGGGWYADLYGSAPKKSPDTSSESSSTSETKKTGDSKKSESTSGDGGGAPKESSKGSGGSDGGSKGSDGGSKGSGSKGGADSSAA